MNNQTKGVQVVSDMLATLGFDKKAFCELFTKEHRTIQQNFTELCIQWIMTCADDSYRYDLRNEDSHIRCKALVDSVDSDFLLG